MGWAQWENLIEIMWLLIYFTIKVMKISCYFRLKNEWVKYNVIKSRGEWCEVYHDYNCTVIQQLMMDENKNASTLINGGIN